MNVTTCAFSVCEVCLHLRTLSRDKEDGSDVCAKLERAMCFLELCSSDIRDALATQLRGFRWHASASKIEALNNARRAVTCVRRLLSHGHDRYQCRATCRVCSRD